MSSSSSERGPTQNILFRDLLQQLLSEVITDDLCDDDENDHSSILGGVSKAHSTDNHEHSNSNGHFHSHSHSHRDGTGAALDLRIRDIRRMDFDVNPNEELAVQVLRTLEHRHLQ